MTADTWKAIDNRRILKKLIDAKSGFRKEQGCTDQIFTLRNIFEQCTDGRGSCISVLFEKASGSMQRVRLWRILRAYGIPLRIVQITESFYHNCTGIEGSSSLKSKSRQTFVRDVSCVQSYLTRL